MHRVFTSLAFLASLFCATAIIAQEQRVDTLAVLAPFIDEQTVAIVRVNLRTLDATAFRKQMIDPLCPTDADRITASVAFEKANLWLAELKSAGGGHIYLVSTLQNMLAGKKFAPDEAVLRSSFVVIPGLVPGRSFDELGALLQANRLSSDAKQNLQLRILNGLAVVAPQELFDLLTAIQPSARPEFEKALAVGKEFPVSFAVAPPAIFARAAEEIITEPAPTSDGAVQSWGSILGRGLRWLGGGAQPNLEKFAAEVVVQSSSSEAAVAFSAAIKQAFNSDFIPQTAGTDRAASTLFAAQLSSLLPQPKGDQLTLQLAGERATTLGMLAKQLYVDIMATTWKRRTMLNLKQIGLALLNYDSANKQLPDRAIRSKDGKPLLSWRVAVLPYADEYGLGLYKQFHLDEPWDSEHNRKLIEKMPDTYKSSGATRSEPGHTRYLAAVGEQCAFPPDRGIKLAEMTDGTSRTIVVVEADPQRAVIWTKPDDFEVELDNPAHGLGPAKQTFNAVFGDGHTEGISTSLDPKKLRAYFTRAAGDKVER